ncbi:MAG: hypothetical protein U9R74_02650 [Pseudomonadota bacterium]|nr:hypothetical protein [Pseudomonadota bacterium]
MSMPGRTLTLLAIILAMLFPDHQAAAQQAPVPRGLIAFVHEDSGSPDISQRRMNLRLMNAQNPAQQVALTNFPVSLRMQDPVWSRDFRQILFSGDFNNGGRSLEGMSIYAINANGTNLRVLTGFGVLGQLPGPTGAVRGQVVSGVGGQLGSCIVTAQGVSQTASCTDGGFVLNNVPAGSIWVRDLVSAAASGSGAGQSFVILMDPGGTNARVIYRPPFDVFDSVIRLVTQTRWSPGGQQIAFVVTTIALDLSAGWSDLFLINADGTNVRQLTRAAPPQFVGSPTWAPSGQALAFDIQIVPDLIQGVVQQSDIFMIGANGANFRRLTADARSFNPAWGLGTPRATQTRDANATEPAEMPGIDAAAPSGPRTWSSAINLDRIKQWIEQMTDIEGNAAPPQTGDAG